jgi:cytochrome b subunit of formate dehydrogenase
MTGPVQHPHEQAGKQVEIVRFARSQRLEHATMMSLFTLLALTGMPQKFPSAALSVWVVHAAGGIEMARLLHRACGLLFTVSTLYHVAILLRGVLRRDFNRFAMVPTRRDLTDAVGTLRFYLGVEKVHPKFDRYDYRQKFEYWGMFAGSVIMIGTGFLLLFPVLVSQLLPGQLIPAAKLAHSQEGLMALLVVLVWHIYNAHLNPDVFPFDWSIFTGRISRHRMEHEHPLELERLDGPAKGKEGV